MSYGHPGVYLTETLLPAPISVGASANAAGAVVASFAQGPEAVTLVTSWYDFTNKFGGFNALFPATFQVGSFFNNGGKELYVKRVLHSDAVDATVNIVTSGAAVVATVTAKNAGADGNTLRASLTAGTVSGTWTLGIYKEGTPDALATDLLLEQYQNINFDTPASSSFAETVINTISSYVKISASASGTPVVAVYPLTTGADGTTPVAADYTSYKSTGASVFEGLSVANRPLVIFLPEVNLLASATTIYAAADTWAAAHSGFVVAETPAADTVATAVTYAGTLTASSTTAVYFPHIFVSDTLSRSSGAVRLIGPSGGVAGLYLRTDTTAGQGVAKAPAGITATLSDAVAAELSFSSADLDTMNSSATPVNPIRYIPGVGLAVMGARTLLQDGTANKYVNMRRSLIYIEKSLKNKTEFAIFQNNDQNLWSQINTVISVFLNEYRNQGGLRGASNAQAFWVKCDAENNTAATIANGQVNIQIGVSLQYPAEFIVINLSQITLA